MAERDSHDQGYVDPTGCSYGLPDGTVCTQYGGLGFRYWVGRPGESELVGGSVQFWEPVLKEDAERFRDELQQEARRRVAMAVAARTGLELSELDLDRIEWLVVWQAEPDTLDRLHAFEAGYSAYRPAGTPVSELTGADVGAMVRRMGLRRGPRP